MRILLLTLALFGVIFAKEQSVKIKIEGMTCPLCTMTIKKNLKKQKGVIKAKVKLNSQMANVKFDDSLIKKEKLLEAIKEVGYKGEFIKEDKGKVSEETK